MEPEQWGVLVVLIIIGTVVGIALTVPTHNPFTPPDVERPNPQPSLTPSPGPPPIKTPTPRITPAPEPTPTPEPTGPRYCLANGSCFWGTPATPTPTPEPTPSPTPLWMGAGFVCEVPDALVGERWAEEYKFSCACLIRGRYDLGVWFNVWESCFSSTSSAWRMDSCECVEVICAQRPGLC